MDLNKTRRQTGQAFSILGQATGAEYKRRRKEEEDYQRRMMRDKFKYGLISAAISPAVQAFGKSATDFAGDLVFGKEENFFKDTEDGRQAAYRAKLNKKRLEELEATRAEILKKGRAAGSTEQYGIDTILEARKKAVQGVAGGPDENLFINEYIYSSEERESARAEWEKQWAELNAGIKTLKAAPSLAEMEAAYRKTAIGQSRGRQAVGRALAWLRGKDYDKDIRKPAIKRILTAGVPGQSQEWYDMSATDLEENYLRASNVVEGLDAYAEKLLKENKPLGESLKNANEARKKNNLLVTAIDQQNVQPFLDQDYTMEEAKEAIVMGVSNKRAPTKLQANRAVTNRISSSITNIIPNSGKAKIEQSANTFFSFEENTENIKRIKEELYVQIYAQANEGKVPKQTYAEAQGRALENSSSSFATYVTAVDSRFENLAAQLVTEAERLVRSDMVANKDEYFSEIPGEGARKVELKTYEYMHLLLESNLGREAVETKEDVPFYSKDKDKVSIQNLYNGSVRRAPPETVKSIKEQLEEQDDLMDVGDLSSLPIFEDPVASNPEAPVVPKPEKSSTVARLQGVAESFISKGMPDKDEIIKVREAIEKREGLKEAIASTPKGQEFLDALYANRAELSAAKSAGKPHPLYGDSAISNLFNKAGKGTTTKEDLLAIAAEQSGAAGRESALKDFALDSDNKSGLGNIKSRSILENLGFDPTPLPAKSGILFDKDKIKREGRSSSLLDKPEGSEDIKSMSILERLGFDPTPLPDKSGILFDKDKIKRKPKTTVKEDKVVEAVEKADKKIDALVQEETPQSKKINKIVSSIKQLKSLDFLTPEQVYTLLGPRSMPYSKKVNGEMVEVYYERQGFSEEIKEAVMQKLYGV